MGVDRDDIIQVLNQNELPMLARAEEAGIPANKFYYKMREFKVAYPDAWEHEVNTWLETAKGSLDKEARLEKIRAAVRARKLAIMEMNHENEEDALLAEEKALDEQLAALKTRGTKKVKGE